MGNSNDTRIVKTLFCECGARTGRKISRYEDLFENVYKLYKSGYFGKCSKCQRNLSPKKFWLDKINGEPMIKKFNKSYEINEKTGCWEWKRYINNGGYGVTYENGKLKIASRASWELFKGEIPDGIVVCHKCDNRKCVNPNHLFLGTQQENVQDAINKNRFQEGVKKRCKLTPEQVEEILSGTRNFKTQQEEADFYGVSRYAIYAIRKRLTRKDVV